VQGETEPEAQITINGQETKNSEKGQFKEEISLAEGVNTITFVVKKKHGKTTTETRHVVYKAKE
jgi:ribosomal 50S subunit-recycling heat shock protein